MPYCSETANRAWFNALCSSVCEVILLHSTAGFALDGCICFAVLLFFTQPGIASGSGMFSGLPWRRFGGSLVAASAIFHLHWWELPAFGDFGRAPAFKISNGALVGAEMLGLWINFLEGGTTGKSTDVKCHGMVMVATSDKVWSDGVDNIYILTLFSGHIGGIGRFKDSYWIHFRCAQLGPAQDMLLNFVTPPGFAALDGGKASRSSSWAWWVFTCWTTPPGLVIWSPAGMGCQRCQDRDERFDGSEITLDHLGSKGNIFSDAGHGHVFCLLLRCPPYRCILWSFSPCSTEQPTNMACTHHTICSGGFGAGLRVPALLRHSRSKYWKLQQGGAARHVGCDPEIHLLSGDVWSRWRAQTGLGKCLGLAGPENSWSFEPCEPKWFQAGWEGLQRCGAAEGTGSNGSLSHSGGFPKPHRIFGLQTFAAPGVEAAGWWGPGAFEGGSGRRFRSFAVECLWHWLQRERRSSEGQLKEFHFSI